MTGVDFDIKLGGIVTDLQTNGKGKAVTISFRNDDNSIVNLSLSSDVNGVVDAVQYSAIENFLDSQKDFADTYETERAPVQIALEAFNVRRATHQVLIDAASAARTALNAALEADGQYQTLKTALGTARADTDYIAAVEAYRVNNVSENYGNLGDAKGKYEV